MRRQFRSELRYPDEAERASGRSCARSAIESEKGSHGKREIAKEGRNKKKRGPEASTAAAAANESNKDEAEQRKQWHERDGERGKQ